MAKRKRTDPTAKRADETDLQWRSRVARHQEVKRQFGEDIVTPEALAKGDLEEAIAPKGENRDKTYRRRSKSSLERLNNRGVITDRQLVAAREVAQVAERIEAEVGMATASMEAKVDNGAGGYDPHYESLHRVRMERAYSEWRKLLPMPRRMIIDMVIKDSKLAAIARSHNRGWRGAIVTLRECLDAWQEEKRRAFAGIDQADVDRRKVA